MGCLVSVGVLWKQKGDMEGIPPTCLWKSLKSRPQHPHLWLRYVDDTFVIQEEKHSQHLLQYINSQDSRIQFTIEEPNQGALPFVDTLVSRSQQHSSHHCVQKPTQTDQYPHCDSNHFYHSKIVFQHFSF